MCRIRFDSMSTFAFIPNQRCFMIFSLFRTLNQIRYHEGLLGQRLGKISTNICESSLMRRYLPQMHHFKMFSCCSPWFSKPMQQGRWIAWSSTPIFSSWRPLVQIPTSACMDTEDIEPFREKCEMWITWVTIQVLWKYLSWGIVNDKWTNRKYYANTWDNAAIEADMLPCIGLRLRCNNISMCKKCFWSRK